jgi:outer membrane lipoprotein carrier protein
VKYWFLIAISLAATIGRADEGARAELVARLDALDRWRATFDQTVLGPEGELIERSTGRVALMKPYFRWDIEAPYPQTLVADGESVRIYDPDLEQLTVRQMDEALDATPLAVLTRREVALGDGYEVTRDGTAFRLVPTSSRVLFADVLLEFGSEGLGVLTIRDQLGQETRITFAPAPSGAVLESGDFELIVPPGTDVIEG